jgi:hypothetical protein
LHHAGAFVTFCTSVHMSQQLEHLTLEFFSANNSANASTVADFSSGFAALTRLHSLKLIGVYGIETLLAHVTRAPALQLLTIEPLCRPYSANNYTLPSITTRGG